MAKIQDIRNQVAPSKTKRKISQITKIARHHSATTSGDYFSFWNHWKSKGWTKGGYAEIILPDGTVQLCYDPIYPTNGVLNHNTNTYHICVVGNGAFTAAQERAFEERCLIAMQSFGLSVEDVLGHNEFSGTSTACPGINMDTVRERLAKLITVESASTKIKEEVRMYRPSTNTLENELALLLEEAHREGLLSSIEWAKKARTGKLTLDDAIGLQATILRRKLASLKK